MRVLIPSEEVKDIVRRLGRRIGRDYEGGSLVVIEVLEGSIYFCRDLLEYLKFVKIQKDSIRARSYREGSTESSGQVEVGETNIDISGRDVLLVEDILDTGRTLAKITEYLRSKNPASLRVVVLLNKPSRREVPFEADYVGREILNAFVIGYGMDDTDGTKRELPDIWAKD